MTTDITRITSSSRSLLVHYYFRRANSQRHHIINTVSQPAVRSKCVIRLTDSQSFFYRLLFSSPHRTTSNGCPSVLGIVSIHDDRVITRNEIIQSNSFWGLKIHVVPLIIDCHTMNYCERVYQNSRTRQHTIHPDTLLVTILLQLAFVITNYRHPHVSFQAAAK